jgi:hypothetical protein
VAMSSAPVMMTSAGDAGKEAVNGRSARTG